MNELQIFKNEEFGEIRTAVEDGKLLFCGKDIAEALGYQRPADAISAHCKGVSILPTPSNGGIQQMKFIPEGDVYRLIVHSKLPSAERFEKWVFDEVLPSIRRNGGYLAGQAELSPEELMAKALLMAQKTIAEREKRIQSLQAQNELKDQIIADFEPIRTYVDTILESPGTMSTAQIAADYDITPQKLNKILHEERVQRKVNGQWILYKSFMGKGYTKSKTFQFTHSDGRRDSRMQTQWTQKGRLMIHEILKARGIIPAADQRNEVA